MKRGDKAESSIAFETDGICPICRNRVTFTARETWLRDHLLCPSCPNGSIPRERALMLVLDRMRPEWRLAALHESSPAPRGTSLKLAEECKGYVATQFFPGSAPGEKVGTFRCENLEKQSFSDRTFDVVITQDVMEHVFDPARAYSEVYRTLAPEGVYIHTTPIYKDRVNTERCAVMEVDGTIKHLCPPEYHGNPVDSKGSLVTFKFGYDLPALIREWTPFNVEVIRIEAPQHGILGEFLEVIVCHRGTLLLVSRTSSCPTLS